MTGPIFVQNFLEFGVGLVPQAHVVIKNTGLTPAYKVQGWIGIGLLPFPSQNPPENVPQEGVASRSVLAPGAEHHLTVYLHGALTENHMEALKTGTFAIHVLGGAIYEDTFGTQRRTTFSYYYGGRYRLNVNNVMSHAPEGNDAN